MKSYGERKINKHRTYMMNGEWRIVMIGEYTIKYRAGRTHSGGSDGRRLHIQILKNYDERWMHSQAMKRQFLWWVMITRPNTEEL
jgi:hypothetical protein